MLMLWFFALLFGTTLSPRLAYICERALLMFCVLVLIWFLFKECPL